VQKRFSLLIEELTINDKTMYWQLPQHMDKHNGSFCREYSIEDNQDVHTRTNYRPTVLLLTVCQFSAED